MRRGSETAVQNVQKDQSVQAVVQDQAVQTVPVKSPHHCPKCWGDLLFGDTPYVTTCGHAFCKSCVENDFRGVVEEGSVRTQKYNFLQKKFDELQAEYKISEISLKANKEYAARKENDVQQLADMVRTKDAKIAALMLELEAEKNKSRRAAQEQAWNNMFSRPEGSNGATKRSTHPTQPTPPPPKKAKPGERFNNLYSDYARAATESARSSTPLSTARSAANVTNGRGPNHKATSSMFIPKWSAAYSSSLFLKFLSVNVRCMIFRLDFRFEL